MKGRRLQNWGGYPHEKGMVPTKLPPWFQKICERLSQETKIFEKIPNHILVNEYLPGGGIMVSNSLYSFFNFVF